MGKPIRKTTWFLGKNQGDVIIEKRYNKMEKKKRKKKKEKETMSRYKKSSFHKKLNSDLLEG